MKLDGDGWLSANLADSQFYLVQIGGRVVCGCLAVHPERRELVLDLAYGQPGGSPRIGGPPVMTERVVLLNESFTLTRLPAPRQGTDPSDLWWTGEGWINQQSEPCPGPMVDVLEREADPIDFVEDWNG